MAAASEHLRFAADEGIPNNPRLPILLHHGIDAVVGDAAACERLFAAHGWSGAWRDGIFPFHHFHSNAHEVLGIVAGEATVRLGGAHGRAFRLGPGDVVVLPAGTGHKREAASPDLLVVGAYPPGQAGYDVRRGDRAEFDEVCRNVSRVALPPGDPVFGPAGPLTSAWPLPG